MKRRLRAEFVNTVQVLNVYLVAFIVAMICNKISGVMITDGIHTGITLMFGIGIVYAIGAFTGLLVTYLINQLIVNKYNEQIARDALELYVQRRKISNVLKKYEKYLWSE